MYKHSIPSNDKFSLYDSIELVLKLREWMLWCENINKIPHKYYTKYLYVNAFYMCKNVIEGILLISHIWIIG